MFNCGRMTESPKRIRNVAPPLSHTNFRDIRPRVGSLTLPSTKKLGKLSLGKTKMRSMDGMLEQQPDDNRGGKLRKSNSENRRPPAPQSSFEEVFERRRSSRRLLEQINTNIAESVGKQLEDEERKLVEEKSGIRESDDKSAYGKLKNVRIDLIPVQTYLTSANTPALPIQTNKEGTVTSSSRCPSSASGSSEVGIQTQTDLSTNCCPSNVAILEDLAELKTDVKAIKQSMALLLSYTQISHNRRQQTQAPSDMGGERKSGNQNTEKLSKNEENRGVEENVVTEELTKESDSTRNDQLNPETPVQGSSEAVDDLNRAARKALLVDSSLDELETEEEDPTPVDYINDVVL